jgi:hypothetical protein
MSNNADSIQARRCNSSCITWLTLKARMKNPEMYKKHYHIDNEQLPAFLTELWPVATHRVATC